VRATDQPRLVIDGALLKRKGAYRGVPRLRLPRRRVVLKPREIAVCRPVPEITGVLRRSVRTPVCRHGFPNTGACAPEAVVARVSWRRREQAMVRRGNAAATARGRRKFRRQQKSDGSGKKRGQTGALRGTAGPRPCRDGS